MIFLVDDEQARWIQKTLSRFRCKNDWANLAGREACWTPEFLSALIDEVDFRLTAGLGHDAYEISRHLQVVAERIRAADCRHGELGKRSLVVWAMACHGSSCRRTAALSEAETTFAAAYLRTQAGVLPWAQADLDRRYAVLLTQRGDRRAYDYIERALKGFAELLPRKAETLILRGVARTEIDQDTSGAIADYTAAAGLIDPRQDERSRWIYSAALHNISYLLIAGGTLSLETISRVRQMLVLTRSYFGPGLCSRKLTSFWVEGLLAFRFGWNRHSERLLEKARRGFLKLECYDHAMVVSLDLALVLIEDGENEEAARRLGEAAENLPESRKHAEEYSGFWKSALDRQALLQTRDKLVGQLPRPNARKARPQAAKN